MSLMSGCLKVEENLNLGDFFQILVLFTDSSSIFWYSFNFLFTYSTLFEIIVFMSWLQLPRVFINSSSLISEAKSSSLSLLGIIATSFFTQTLSSSLTLHWEISWNACATSSLGLEFLSLICSQMEL